MTEVGRLRSHESAEGHVSGAAKYTDDLVGLFQGVLHCCPIVSPFSHAEVLSIDLSKAKKVPGVVDVLTREDVPGENDTGAAVRDEPLFPSEVSYLSQPIAWVLGETEESARQGAKEACVEYRSLPVISSIEGAIDQNSYLTEDLKISRGDVENAMLQAENQLSGELFIGGQEHFYLETQAALACKTPEGTFFVYASTQHPSETQEVVARVLGVPKSNVTCETARMGGAFGGKEVQANPWAAVAALGVAKTGRPVRVRLTRTEDMLFTGKRHPFLGRFEVGFDGRGKISALRMRLFSDGGWSADLSRPVLWRAMFHVDNAYFLENVEVTGRVCRTHSASNTAFRGFGGPQAMVLVEDVIDRIARTLRLAPEEVRARNFYKEGDKTHYGQTVKDAGRISQIWDSLLERSDFAVRSQEIRESNGRSPHQKRGIAITPVKFGISFTTACFNQAGALVLIYKDGSVQVNHGGTEMGQGLHTKMRQIAADALGVGLDAILVAPTRTDKVPNTSATAASSSSDLNGAALKAACELLRERLVPIARRLLSRSTGDVIFRDGLIFTPSEPGESVSFSEVVASAYLGRVKLFETGYYATPGIEFDEASGQGTPFHYFAFGAAVSEVVVDGFTGQRRLVRVDILHDVGDSISPLVDRGQVEGGFIQGVGWLGQEELVSSKGRLMTRGASTYKLPGVGECPEIFNVWFLDGAQEASVVHGSKAVGEPPLMLAISYREALRDAVSAFGGMGPIDLSSPATPEAVFWAIDGSRN